MLKIWMSVGSVLCGLIILGTSQWNVFAQSPCDRFPAGSTVSQPEDLYSKNGVLAVEFTYQTTQGPFGNPITALSIPMECNRRRFMSIQATF
jgi:hypothetical protein